MAASIRRLTQGAERHIVLGLVVGALVPTFGFTQFAVARYRGSRQNLAVEWSGRGARDLAEHPAAAVTDFETALAYAPDNATDRFLLARALVATSRLGEAKAQLLTLLADQPARGDVNLELARIAAREHDVSAGIRYYDAAIDGTWDANAPAVRRQARIELARWLMANGQPLRAQAELIAVVDDLPPDAALITDVGSLLLDAGAPNRALPLFEKAMQLDPANARAARLAGQVEFAAGNMRAARRHLQDAASRGGLDDAGRDMLDVSARVISLDPFAGTIGARVRLDRVRRALAIAEARLNRCELAPSPDAATRTAIADLTERVADIEKARAHGSERDPDFLDTAMTAVFDIEKLPSSACGPDSADDRALTVIAGQHASR